VSAAITQPHLDVWMLQHAQRHILVRVAAQRCPQHLVPHQAVVDQSHGVRAGGTCNASDRFGVRISLVLHAPGSVREEVEVLGAEDHLRERLVCKVRHLTQQLRAHLRLPHRRHLVLVHEVRELPLEGGVRNEGVVLALQALQGPLVLQGGLAGDQLSTRVDAIEKVVELLLTSLGPRREREGDGDAKAL
jgi:hypothetical protein